MPRILVIDDDANLLQMVKLMLERVGHEVSLSDNGSEGIQLAGQTQPDLAIIDVMMPGLSGYDVVRKLRQDPLTARIPIIILTARSQPMDKHMALEAGANAFLSKPVTASELTERVDAVLRAGVEYRVHTGLLTEPVTRQVTPPPVATAAPLPRVTPSPAALVRPLERPEPPGVENVTEQPTTPSGPQVSPPVLTVAGLRGGTGSTTVAINLAFLLASRGRRVCLVDLSTTSGHIALYLHLNPQQHWGQLLGVGDRPEASAVQAALTYHQPSGMAVLAAPTLPGSAALSGPATESILRTLASTFNHIVVDAPTLDTASLAALRVARSVITIMTDDPPALQTTGQLLLALQNAGIDAARVRVVLNYVRPTRDVPAETIQKALKRPLSAEIPYEPNQVAAVRRGMPLVVAEPNGAFAQALHQLARTLTL